MRVLLILVLLLVAVLAQAQVYRTVDENGNIVFSDQPLAPNSEEMNLPPLSVMDPTPIPATATAGEAGEAASPAYADLAMIEPIADQTYWGTSATIAVQLNTARMLRSSDQVVILLNGQEAVRGRSLSAMLTGIERGEHTVAARIVDSSGNTLASVGPVIVHMKQQSRRN